MSSSPKKTAKVVAPTMPSLSLARVSIHHPQRVSNSPSAQSPSAQHFAVPPRHLEELLHTLSCSKWPHNQALGAGTVP